MDVYCPPVRDADWHDAETEMQREAREAENDTEWRRELIDLYVRTGWGFRTTESPAVVSFEAERGLKQSKLRRLVLSCILSSSLCLVSLVFGLGDLIGLFRVLHPFFWFPIAAGACGVAGSNFIYLRRLWPA